MKQSLIPYLKYSNVRSFVVQEGDKLVIISYDKRCKIVLKNLENEGEECSGSTLFNTTFNYVLTSGDVFVHDNEAHRLNIEGGEFEGASFNNIAVVKSINQRVYFFVNLDTNEILKKISFEDLPRGVRYFNEKIIISIFNTNKILDDIRVINLSTGELLWKFDALSVIPEEYASELNNIINTSIPFVFHKDLLIFTTYKTLTALNVYTGELIYNKEHKGHGRQVYENGIIYSHVEVGAVDIFSRFNADTGDQITSKTIERSMFSSGNESLAYTEINLTDKHVIFTYRAGIHIIFLNKETLEIEHVFNIKQTAKERKASIPIRESKPVLQDGKLYQLLGNGELMVFDMEGLL